MGPGDALDVAVKLFKLGLFLYKEGQDGTRNLPRDSAERVRVEAMNQEVRAMIDEWLAYEPRPDNPE